MLFRNTETHNKYEHNHKVGVLKIKNEEYDNTGKYGPNIQTKGQNRKYNDFTPSVKHIQKLLQKTMKTHTNKGNKLATHQHRKSIIRRLVT